MLAPLPLSEVPLQTGFENEGSSSRARRTKGDEELRFRLFKFPDAWEQYILEIHEVGTGKVSRCHLMVYQNNGKWRIRKTDFKAKNHGAFPVMQDPYPLVFQKKYNEHSLEQRLLGWTVEKRKRSSGKEDTLYYHQGKQFRSFVETVIFILYSNKLKDLQLIATAQIPPQTPAF